MQRREILQGQHWRAPIFDHFLEEAGWFSKYGRRSGFPDRNTPRGRKSSIKSLHADDVPALIDYRNRRTRRTDLPCFRYRCRDGNFRTLQRYNPSRTDQHFLLCQDTGSHACAYRQNLDPILHPQISSPMISPVSTITLTGLLLRCGISIRVTHCHYARRRHAAVAPKYGLSSDCSASRARCKRTFTLDSEMPSNSAVFSVSKSSMSRKIRTVR